MLLRTDKITLTDKEIIKFINSYESTEVPELNNLWEYYVAKDTKILTKKKPDPNNPDNRTPVPYGRKIVTTFTGYAYRPNYITYQSNQTDVIETVKATFKLNQEHVKTSRAGRNTAIFGKAYEIVYIDGVPDETLPVKAEPRFFSVDPREMILFYDYSPEPKKQIAIRYYDVDPVGNTRKVEVYYKDTIVTYDMERSQQAEPDGTQLGWMLTSKDIRVNFFGDVPVVAYYFGDEMLGIIKPVQPLIDDYDLLVSDSINEFDRFAHAYLRLVKMSLTDPVNNKTPGADNRKLQLLKRRRIFEDLPDKDAVSFLTKDIPTGFMEFMTNLIRQEIHVQSHVPDFSDKTFASDISGVAVQRLLFDFENVVSSAEADFDIGLQERLELMAMIYQKGGRQLEGKPEDITITHTRNLPSDWKESAETGKILKESGFSRETVIRVQPAEVVPDREAELERQVREELGIIDIDIDGMVPEDGSVPVDDDGNVVVGGGEPTQDTALNGAQIKSLLEIVQEVAIGNITSDTAKPLIGIAFPSVSQAEIEALLRNMAKIEEPAEE